LARREKILSSTENYFQAGGTANLTDYFTSKGILFYKTLSMNNNIVMNVSFLPADKNFTSGYDLILFRNQLLYYGKHLHNQMLALLSKKLQKGGILIIGHKEKIDATERIYRKK
jgi:chemotaxis methyl-accepting protein methylase